MLARILSCVILNLLVYLLVTRLAKLPMNPWAYFGGCILGMAICLHFS